MAVVEIFNVESKTDGSELREFSFPHQAQRQFVAT